MFGTLKEYFTNDTVNTMSTLTYTYTTVTAIDTRGILIKNLPDSIGRGTDGNITEAALADYMSSLITSKKIPGSPPTPTTDGNQNETIKGYILAQNTFLEKTQEEYNYYNDRYKYSLNKFLELLANTVSANIASSETQNWLDATIILNKRINDIITIFTYLSSYYLTQSRNNNNTINDINSQLETRSNQIKVEGELLRRKGGDKELYEKMVEYSTVKARATNNLLSLYGCMNIVALGILFYVYKATANK
jgi:hypothetical protein